MTVALALPLIGVKRLLVPEKPLTVVEIKLPLPTGTWNQVCPVGGGEKPPVAARAEIKGLAPAEPHCLTSGEARRGIGARGGSQKGRRVRAIIHVPLPEHERGGGGCGEANSHGREGGCERIFEKRRISMERGNDLESRGMSKGWAERRSFLQETEGGLSADGVTSLRAVGWTRPGRWGQRMMPRWLASMNSSRCAMGSGPVWSAAIFSEACFTLR